VTPVAASVCGGSHFSIGTYVCSRGAIV